MVVLRQLIPLAATSNLYQNANSGHNQFVQCTHSHSSHKQQQTFCWFEYRAKPLQANPKRETPQGKPLKANPKSQTPTGKPHEANPARQTPRAKPQQANPKTRTPTGKPPRAKPYEANPSRQTPQGKPLEPRAKLQDAFVYKVW